METKARSCIRGLWNFITMHYEGLILLLPPLICFPILLSSDVKANGCMYVLVIMLIYWTSEVIPLGITSLIPVFAFPTLGIMDTEAVCTMYCRDVLVMFIASIMIATAIEYSNLHIRIALKMLQVVGCSPRRLHFGVCMATMFLSMWIANSACTAMMCPIIYAVLEELSAQGIIRQYHEDDLELPIAERRPSNIASCFYLSITFASSIGGCGTLIGTPTNLAFKAIYDSRFEEATDQITFGMFMAYALPPAIVSNIVMYLCMEYLFMGLFRPNSQDGREANIGAEGEKISKKVINDKYIELGAMNAHETSVALLFVFLVLLYVFKKPEFIDGWEAWFNESGIKNSVPAVFILTLLFVLPANYDFLTFSQDRPREVTPALLQWSFVIRKVPWGLIFLVGGGSALSEGTNQSGMATKMGKAFSVIDVLPPSLVLYIITVTAVIMTNFTANVAICNILVPIVVEMAVAMKVHPLSMIYPVGIGSSISFILPVGTPANAMVQGYSNLPTKTMMWGGTLPSITTTTLFWLFAETWGYVVYPNFDTYPAWADLKPNGSKTVLKWD